MGGENSGKVVNKLQSLVILSRARGVDRLSLETAHQPNPCPMELPLEVMHCGQGAGEAQHLNDAAFRLCHTPRGDQYPHHSHSYEGGGVVGAVPNKTNLTRSRVKQVEGFPLGATSPGVRHPLEEADPHLVPVVDGSLTDHTLDGDEDQPLEVATSGSSHIHCGDQPLCLVEPPGGKLWQKGQIVRTVDVVGKGEDSLVVAASTSAVRNTYATETARLLAEFDCRGEAGAFWVKEVPLVTDAPRLLCAGPDCGNPTLFFCSGCKVTQFCSKLCQIREWKYSKYYSDHGIDCGRKFKHLKGAEYRDIMEASRPPPLIHCEWLRGPEPFANICWYQGCGRAGRFSCNACNLEERQVFYCSSSCHKAEVDSWVAAMVADRPRGCLRN